MIIRLEYIIVLNLSRIRFTYIPRSLKYENLPCLLSVNSVQELFFQTNHWFKVLSIVMRRQQYDHLLLKKREEETQFYHQNTICISSNCYYQVANITSKRKVKSTSHIQQTPKTKQFSSKKSTPTPSSLIPFFAAVNKKNCIPAEALLEEQQKKYQTLFKKLIFWRREYLNLKSRPTLLK